MESDSVELDHSYTTFRSIDSDGSISLPAPEEDSAKVAEQAVDIEEPCTASSCERQCYEAAMVSDEDPEPRACSSSTFIDTVPA
ncbi:hypothetical protein MTO96_023146 [Rhipicephalus appendiculatus]